MCCWQNYVRPRFLLVQTARGLTPYLLRETCYELASATYAVLLVLRFHSSFRWFLKTLMAGQLRGPVF